MKSDAAFRTISEVADELGVPQHVLRFWESKFPAVKPVKRSGNRRYYRPEDIALLKAINHLLYTDGFTIRGVQKLLKEHGHRRLTSEVLNRMASGGDDGGFIPGAAIAEPSSLERAPEPADTPPEPRPSAQPPVRPSGAGEGRAEHHAALMRTLQDIRDELAQAVERK